MSQVTHWSAEGYISALRSQFTPKHRIDYRGTVFEQYASWTHRNLTKPLAEHPWLGFYVHLYPGLCETSPASYVGYVCFTPTISRAADHCASLLLAEAPSCSATRHWQPVRLSSPDLQDAFHPLRAKTDYTANPFIFQNFERENEILKSHVTFLIWCYPHGDSTI